MKENTNILLIDDDVILRKLMSVHLKREGYTVHVAENGNIGCELFEKEDVDIIVLDVMMPVMDGFKFLNWLRNEKKSDTPVLSLTGMETKSSEQLLLDAGTNKVLFKPVKVPQIKEHIESLLDKSKDMS